MELTEAQAAAVEHVRRGALGRADAARRRLDALLSPQEAAELLGRIRERGRVTLNFHPDRLLADGRTIAEAMLDEGVYRNQFESGVSNGSRTAFPGGDRDQWEEQLFGGAYHRPGVAPADRPRYGALDLMGHLDGGSPRFGSCHVRLRAGVVARSTFSAGDSHLLPDDIGTIDAFECVLAGHIEREGVPDLDGGPCIGRVMDGYIEAQVHGPVFLHDDVEVLVVDPSFHGTPTGEVLAAAADRYGIEMRTHPGYIIRVDDVTPELRGPRIPPLAARVVDRYGRPGQPVAPALIGAAARSVLTEPAEWADWGDPDDTLQELKYLWHHVVIAGSPAASYQPR